MKDSAFVRNAATVSVGSFLAKAIGAAYKIPLIALIGAEGIGIYQMIYPLYCVLLTVAATGIPSGLARIVSNDKNSAFSAFRRTVGIYLPVGILASALMFICADAVSRLQAEDLSLYYRILSPSVACVAIISCFRGYFQGNGIMLPTAISEVAEQLIKAGLALTLAFLFKGDQSRSVAGLVAAVTVSEFITAIGFAVYFRKHTASKPIPLKSTYPAKKILAFTLPLTVTAAILPISGFFDSILTVRLLSAYQSDAVASYGLYSGGAITVINLIVSLCYGIAAAAVPHVSASDGAKTVKARITKALFLTFVTSSVLSICLYIGAPLAVQIIFRSLSTDDRALLATLIRRLCLSAVTFSCMQTLSACLTGIGRPSVATASTLIAAVLKTVLQAVCIRFVHHSILGAVFAYNAAFLVAFCLNLMYIIVYYKNQNIKNGGVYEDYRRRSGNRRGGPDLKGLSGNQKC